MRIMTYNIHGWRTIDGKPNWDGVARVVEEVGADIVGLNEVHYPRVVEGSDKPALEALAGRLGMHFVFGPCLRWPAQDDLPAAAFGNALLSRWPIIASAAHHLAPKEADQQRLLEGKEQRGLLEGRILLPDGQTFTVYVTHLDHTDEETRLVQLRAARQWLGRDRNRPHIVMGDFNAMSLWDYVGREDVLRALEERKARPDRSHHGVGDDGPRVIAQMEKAGYTDLYRLFGQPAQATYTATPEPPIRIDYIFGSQPIVAAVKACTIWTEADEVSDHRAIVALIELAGLERTES